MSERLFIRLSIGAGLVGFAALMAYAAVLQYRIFTAF